jgi:hypothetical protein
MKQGKAPVALSKGGFDANEVHEKTSTSLFSLVRLIKKPFLASLIHRISKGLLLG